MVDAGKRDFWSFTTLFHSLLEEQPMSRISSCGAALTTRTRQLCSNGVRSPRTWSLSELGIVVSVEPSQAQTDCRPDAGPDQDEHCLSTGLFHLQINLPQRFHPVSVQQPRL